MLNVIFNFLTIKFNSILLPKKFISSADGRWIFLACSLTFIAMLCKEIGIASLPVCCAMEILVNFLQLTYASIIMCNLFLFNSNKVKI